jgi:hypothetical protein
MNMAVFERVFIVSKHPPAVFGLYKKVIFPKRK